MTFLCTIIDSKKLIQFCKNVAVNKTKSKDTRQAHVPAERVVKQYNQQRNVNRLWLMWRTGLGFTSRLFILINVFTTSVASICATSIVYL